MAGESSDLDAKPILAIAELTVVIVSYKTRDLTLKAVETLIDNSPGVAMRIIVFDNASDDGSAEAVAALFPNVDVIANPENIGFARANNVVAAAASTEWLLLLNPDTGTFPGSIARLLAFGKAHPEAGIVGGGALFSAGERHPSPSWERMCPGARLAPGVGPSWQVPMGIGLMWLMAAMRGLGSLIARRPEQRARLRRVWDERGDWLPGFGPK